MPGLTVPEYGVKSENARETGKYETGLILWSPIEFVWKAEQLTILCEKTVSKFEDKVQNVYSW